MKQLVLSLLFVLVGSILIAQDRTVTGNIVDSDTGEPLPGVSIAVKGTTTGTTTDINGKFSLSVAQDAVLVVSYIGYSSQEIAVQSRTVVDFSLSPDISELSEVVIIGYGQTTVRDATGSVAAITSEDFNQGVISSPEQLIQGKTAGVQITSTSGAPGASVELRIRGTNSVRSNNNPLFVVDGVPLSGGQTSSDAQNIGVGTSVASNPLNFLNPNDIESISILKDASSAAIYGSRGANGVVFITTKKGQGKGTLEYATSISVASPAEEYDLLTREAFLAGVTQFGGDAGLNDLGSTTDWQDEITRTAISNKHNISYSQGLQNGSIRGSFGFDNQQGVIENSGLERITGRINANREFLDERLNLTTQLTLTRTNEESAPIGGSAGFRGDLLGAAYSANPTWPGSIEGLDDAAATAIIGGQTHPNNLLENHQSIAKTNRFLWNFSVSYNLTDELTAKATYGLDKSNSERISLLTADTRNVARGTQGNGRGGYNRTLITNDLVEFTLTYNKEFGNSKIEAVGGYSFQDFGNERFDGEGWGFSSTDFGAMEDDLVSSVNALRRLGNEVGGFWQQAGYASVLTGGTQGSGAFVNALLPEVGTTYSGIPGPGAGATQSAFVNRFNTVDKLQSFFGRINYSLYDKFLFTFTVRADGSSRFGDDEKYGVFPSGAFAWKLDEEDFIGESISTLKLRLGYGVTGNQDGLGYGGFVRRERYDDRTNTAIADGGDVAVPGVSAVALPNPELKWEETTAFNVGLDFGFGNERFYGSIDYYSKETTDLIFRLNAAQPAQAAFIFANFPALVTNKGFELALNYDVIQSTDFTFTAGFNFSHNDNEITDFGGQIPAGTIRGQGLSQAFAQLLADNQPLFSFYLREFEGFDANGQPIGDNQTFVDKGALPVVNTGISLNFTYKNWDLAAYLSGQYGHYVYNNTRNAFFTAGAINNARNVTPDVLTSGEAGTAEAAVSTRFLESADFMRLQTLSLGYNVPVQGSGIFSNLRVNISAQNLFIITDYTGLDPEVSSQPSQGDLLNELPTAGIDYTAYPRPRVFTLGVNARF